LRFLLNLLLMLVVALAIGFGLSWYALSDGRLFGAAQIGPWIAWPRAGSPAPDPYTRAHAGQCRFFEANGCNTLLSVSGEEHDERRAGHDPRETQVADPR